MGAMGDDVLTTWGIVLDHEAIVDVERPTSAGDWFAEDRGAFFDRCPRLAAFLSDEDAELRVTAEQVGPVDIASGAVGVRIGVSVVEVRPSSFTMALRVRPHGDDGDPPANGRYTLVIERRASGERVLIPREVRDEFVAIQLGARDLC